MAFSFLFQTAPPVFQNHKFSSRQCNLNRATLPNSSKRIILQNQYCVRRAILRGNFSTRHHQHDVRIIARQPPPPNHASPTRSSSFPLSRDTSFASPFVIVRKIAYDVLFPLLIIFVTVWLTSALLRRLQRKQLSIQKSQPHSIQFSFLVDVNHVAPFASENASTAPVSEDKTELDVDQFLDIEHQDVSYSDMNQRRRYEQVPSVPVDNVPSKPINNVPSKPDDDVPSKLQLQLFRKSNVDESVRNPQNKSYPLKASAMEPTETVENNHEAMFVGALIDAMTVASDSSVNDGERKAAGVLSSTLNNIDISNSLKSSITMNVVSRLVSTAVDDVVSILETRDAQVMATLGVLSNTMRAAQVVAPGLMLKYVGKRLQTETSLEDIYRRYAVYCMSTEQRLMEDLESLHQMQRFLDIRDSKAQAINAEIASSMFQVAVSAAMAGGVVSDEDRRRLETLKASFGKYLPETTADTITKEVMVMRTMYALQQLVQGEDISEQDVQRLRKMCHDLGGDIEEVVRNADALGNALGVEAKDFSIRLRTVLLGFRTSDKSSHSSTTP